VHRQVTFSAITDEKNLAIFFVIDPLFEHRSCA